MKSGIQRKVDDLGRVVIPAGIRRSLGIREGDVLEVSVQGDKVILSKRVDECVFCHSDRDLQTFRDKAVCASCAGAVGMLGNHVEATFEHDGTARNTPLPDLPDPPQTEGEAGAVPDGRLRMVRDEADTLVTHEELPASTTAW